MPLKSHGITSFRSRCQGFTLIEVMVAVLVLAVGLLGLAGLQVTSLRFNSSAYMRSQATNLAYDMADRMRVNVEQARLGTYDDVDFVGTPTCTPDLPLIGSLDEQDEQAWQNALACTLPLGTGRIQRNGTVFTIIIQWDDNRDSTDLQQFAMDTDL